MTGGERIRDEGTEGKSDMGCVTRERTRRILTWKKLSYVNSLSGSFPFSLRSFLPVISVGPVFLSYFHYRRAGPALRGVQSGE